MTNQLPTGPKRYAGLEKNDSISTADSKPSPNKNAFYSSPPYCTPETDTIIASNPFAIHGRQTPFLNIESHKTLGFNTVSSQPNVMMMNRRRSSKGKGAELDQVPRPDILAETSYSPNKYITNQLYSPPPSFSNYITIDNGNAGPRYIRSSFYKVPTEESLANNLHIPFGVIIQPLAEPVMGEENVQVSDYGEMGPLRCKTCRAYVNPNWIFIQGGETVICNLCKRQTPVPSEYFCPLDASGNRADTLQRAELCKGVYEFIAPSSYHARKVVMSNIVICVEASTACYMSGIFHQVMSSLLTLLDYMPCPDLTNICIITYDCGVTFFRVPEDLNKEISVIRITEIEEPCLPLPKHSLLLNLKDDRNKINYLIDKIIKYYESNIRLQKCTTTTSCFGTALLDCCNLLQQDGGRILIFTTQTPTIGLGTIKKRDDFKLHGTDKERTLYVPQIEEYGEWAQRLLANRTAVDLFCFAHEYFDLATIGQVCNLTGGNIYYYPSYNGTYDGERLHYDLCRNLSRPVGYDVIMTIRSSEGISFLDYTLPYGRKPTPELQFSTIDADTVINACFKHEEKIKDEVISIQTAILYTNVYGQRVIRVINLNLATSNELPAIFKSADVEVVAQLIIKRHILNINNSAVPKIRKDLIDNLVKIFRFYKINCVPSHSPTQLVFPDQLQILPIFILAALKLNIMRSIGDTKPDDRSFDLHRVLKMPLNVLSNLLYPKIYPVHTIYEDDDFGPGNIADDRVIMGSNIPTTDEKLESTGIYLIDNNDTIFIYVKKNADPILIQELFGVETFQEVSGLAGFTDNDGSSYLVRVLNIIDQLRKNKNSSYQPLRIVTERDPAEPSLLNLLVEDERLGESYHTFLCNLHKQIQEKL